MALLDGLYGNAMGNQAGGGLLGGAQGGLLSGGGGGGFFGQSMDDPRTAFILNLAAGLAGTRGRGRKASFGEAFSTGMQGGMQAYQQAQMGAQQRKLIDSQMAENEAQAKQRTTQLEAAQRAQQQQQAFFQSLNPASRALAGGGGPTVQNAQAMAANPAGSIGPADYQRGIAAGIKPEILDALANAQNAGKPKIKQYQTVRGPDGLPMVVGLDEHGRQVQTGATPWEKPEVRDFGGHLASIDPVTGRQTRLGDKSLSPDARASNALGWANHAVSKERLSMERSAPRGQFIETPDGFVLGDPRTGTVAPVMGPNGQQLLGKSKNQQLTDSQAKANLFGTRMQEADRILQSLDGKYKPFDVNAKAAMESIPGVGGLAGGAANLMLSSEGQQAEQAQRDFINAVLRRESGAVIADSEFNNARKQYFPQPFDSEKTKAQKAQSRKTAIEGLMAEVPEGRRGVPSLGGSGGAGRAAPKSKADFDALPSGTEFVAPDGSIRRKP